MIDLTPILQAIIGLCAALITVYFIPWLKEKAGQEKTARLMRMTEIAVRAAEQMYEASGDKLNYVLQYLAQHGFTLSADELRAAVEAAVYDMNQAAQTVDAEGE